MTDTHTPTPGPWIVRRKDGPPFNDITRPDGKLIATAYPTRLLPTGRTDKSSIPEAEANARLIAAAPDLLGALESLFALVNGECPSILEDDHHFDWVTAVLSKARGES